MKQLWNAATAMALVCATALTAGAQDRTPAGTSGAAGTPGASGTPGTAGTPGTTGTAGTPGATGLPGTLDATTFVMMSASSDMFEIRSSQLALERASSAELRRFAQHMVDDHTRTTQELKTLAGQKGMTLPAAMMPIHQTALQTVQGARGAEFDRTYLDGQVRNHRLAVQMLQQYSRSGEDADLKAWATKTLPAVREHTEMAERMASVGGARPVGTPGATPGARTPGTTPLTPGTTVRPAVPPVATPGTVPPRPIVPPTTPGTTPPTTTTPGTTTPGTTTPPAGSQPPATPR